MKNYNFHYRNFTKIFEFLNFWLILINLILSLILLLNFYSRIISSNLKRSFRYSLKFYFYLVTRQTDLQGWNLTFVDQTFFNALWENIVFHRPIFIHFRQILLFFSFHVKNLSFILTQYCLCDSMNLVSSTIL